MFVPRREQLCLAIGAEWLATEPGEVFARMRMYKCTYARNQHTYPLATHTSPHLSTH